MCEWKEENKAARIFPSMNSFPLKPLEVLSAIEVSTFVGGPFPSLRSLASD